MDPYQNLSGDEEFDDFEVISTNNKTTFYNNQNKNSLNKNLNKTGNKNFINSKLMNRTENENIKLRPSFANNQQSIYNQQFNNKFNNQQVNNNNNQQVNNKFNNQQVNNKNFKNFSRFYEKKPSPYKSNVNESAEKSINLTKPLNSATDYRNIIISSMGNAVVCPIGSLPSVICESFGTMFDYKNAICKNGRHVHKTLSIFLGCCNDFIKILNFNVSFAKRCDQLGQSISKQRFYTHFKYSKKENFLSHLEIMIVNMLPAKTTMNINDLKLLFREIYNSDIEAVCKEKGFDQPIIEIIQGMMSSNLFITINAKGENVTCIPMNHPEYNVQNIQGFIEAKKAEEMIFKKKNIQLPERVLKTGNDFGVSWKTVLNRANIPEIVDYNIPRSIQKIQNLDINIEDFTTKKGIDPVYFLIRRKVKLDDVSVFFDIPD
ncbi:hypothetical protein DMUE_2918 [Dictyocoela muelleri]|nr:hypothetical protein DMUE_2918 [Dictyocoela muelleri]